MQRLKNAFYEHRFGLFFFVFLMVYNVFGNSMNWGAITEVTFLIHTVDFSIGACSKLLPGAICNFVLGEVTEARLYIYLSTLIIVSFLLISLLLEKLLLSLEGKIKELTIVLAVFFVSGVCTFSFHFQYMVWFDFYWMFFAVISILALTKKETYFFVIPLMIATCIIHYAAIICYVPFVAIIILYKISTTERNSEKRYLWIIWVALVVCTISLSVYLMLWETENVRISMEELTQKLLSKGFSKDSVEYYQFGLFREKKIELNGDNNVKETIGIVDGNKPLIWKILQLIVQQTKITFLLSGTGLLLVLEYILLIMPLCVFMFRIMALDYFLSRNNKTKRFAILCSIALFVFTLVSGRLFSTDAIRWVSNALIPLMATTFYVIYKGNDVFKERIGELYSRIPFVVVAIYYVIYAFLVV